MRLHFSEATYIHSPTGAQKRHQSFRNIGASGLIAWAEHMDCAF